MYTHTHAYTLFNMTYSFIEINRGCICIYIYGINVSFHFCARYSTRITFVVFDLQLSSFVAFCYTFTKKNEGRGRYIVIYPTIRCVGPYIYIYIYIYIRIHICIPCLFEYLFRISGKLSSAKLLYLSTK